MFRNNLLLLLSIHFIEDTLDYQSSQGTHWFSKMTHEVKPVDEPFLVNVGLFEYLELIFFKEQSILIESLYERKWYFLEMNWIDHAGNFWILLGKRPINSSEVGHELILGQFQTNLKHEPIDLSIELDSKERHFIDLCYINKI